MVIDCIIVSRVFAIIELPSERDHRTTFSLAIDDEKKYIIKYVCIIAHQVKINLKKPCSKNILYD